tara:strand:+ start:4963 stop:5610 length:648 start_codon:yes stop_codon:yes gene_type:complete
MKDHVINSFIVQEKNTFNDIYKYACNFNKKILKNYIKKEIKNKIKHGHITTSHGYYVLTTTGNHILKKHKEFYYYEIALFFKKFYNKTKIYTLNEIRPEQKSLRDFLINNKSHKCIICDKKLPLCLLETAHLKPRSILNNTELNDTNIVEFMCRYCHKLYDDGMIAVKNGKFCKIPELDKYDLNYDYSTVDAYNESNKKYFNYHYTNIYRHYTEM